MIEMVENDRIVGGLAKAATVLNRALYATFCSGEPLLTNARNAEMEKLTENAFRDGNIGFANELSIIIEWHGINVWELIELTNHHPESTYCNADLAWELRRPRQRRNRKTDRRPFQLNTS